MEFLTNWLMVFLFCTLVLVGIGAVIAVIWIIMEIFGAWTFLLLLPAGLGLMVAIAEL